ncbi:MAG: ADP-ribosylglycohydrolase family protein [Kiritimatiellae bacterium]|nr:ADP-ribosylglycohydrolase family protein [Kiritimatiellia bacterium]
MVACPVFGLPVGYWTDDGSMAMCVMDSFVRKGGYDLKDVVETFVKWLKEGYLSSIEGSSFDMGNATYDSVMAFSSTGSLVNGSEESQGNGSIMRFAPSYLIARALGRPEIIHEVSDVTHASPPSTLAATPTPSAPSMARSPARTTASTRYPNAGLRR